MFSDLAETLLLAFLQTLFERDFFQTLHRYNLAQGLPSDTMFDDLDLVSRLQVCQNHKLQIVVSILVHRSLKCCRVLTYIKKTRNSILCDCCVFERHNKHFVFFVVVVFSMLHLNVSHLSICFSCSNGSRSTCKTFRCTFYNSFLQPPSFICVQYDIQLYKW